MSRTNFEACRAKCKLICNTCYVDKDVIEDVLESHSISPDGQGGSDASLMECAILIVRGWVETSRSEGGISTSIDMEAVKNNILFWCGQYDLDAEELLSGSLSVIDNASNLW